MRESIIINIIDTIIEYWQIFSDIKQIENSFETTD